MPSLVGREHKSLKLDECSEEIKKRVSELAKSGQGKSETLGLHSRNGEIRPGNFIGAIWVDGDVLRVDSKFPKMDYIKMFAECCEHSVIGEKMSKCFECWSGQELIELPDADDFSSMIVIAYLRELNQLCVRHLRRHFERRRENFTGKVKGKILVGENIRRNVVHARPDRVFCEYQSISDDILENRILRAALEKATRYISQNKMAKKHKSLNRWIHACRTHLHGVSVTHISRCDFSAARKRGVFSFYRHPLNLAKAVLYHFGFNPHEENSKLTKTPPYAINSAELFERYAQLRLLKEYPNLKALYTRPESVRGDWVNVRPDFYVPRKGDEEGGEAWIIDAKYKDISKESDRKKRYSRNDIYQIITYSRHSELLKRVDSEKKADNINLSLAYPDMDKLQDANKPPEEGEIITDFLSPITIYKIPCPVKADKEPSQ